MAKFDVNHPAPCLYKKHGAYWYVKKRKWTRLGTTLEEALAEYGRKLTGPRGGMAELIEEYYTARNSEWKENTRKQYRRAADILKRKLVQFAPQDVKSSTVFDIQESLRKTPAMSNRVVSFLRAVMTYAAKKSIVEFNPAAGVKLLKEPGRDRLISMDEWRAIHDKAGPRLQAIMKIAYLTGQRIGDVLRIHRSQLGETGIAFTQQKTGKRLIVKWSPDLRAAVAEALALHRGVPALTLFLGRKGKPPDYRSVLLQWHEACTAAGIEDALPNDQRAQSATHAKRQGKNATELLGHSTEAMTNRYLRDREATEVEGPAFEWRGYKKD